MRQHLFSVTAKDCEWSYTKGSGAGGQKRNKTSSAVHCSHRASGAHGFAQEHREQHRNKQLAFQRMTDDPRFQVWLAREMAVKSGRKIEARTVEEVVEEQMAPENLRIEFYDPAENS